MSDIDIIDKYWKASCYISLGCLYLKDNPLLERDLIDSDIKEKLVGHWGTVPGQNFIYTHLNRIIKKYNLDMLYISGPGHGGNASVSQSYLEGTLSKCYPKYSKDKEGMKTLFKEFSYPYGLGSHATPEVPGSIHEGGELGYSLIHGYGAVLDNPNLIVAVCIGDGEAETGTLATSWQINKFINPKKDGIVLPILHLNGYKISNPTILARMSNKELICYFTSLRYHPYIVEGLTDYELHKNMMDTLDKVVLDIKNIKENINSKQYYPMIILRSKKGWGCPKEVNGKVVEGTFHSHQIPISRDTPNYLEYLNKWFKSYQVEELFNSNGTLKDYLEEYIPTNKMSSNINSNIGIKNFLNIPDVSKYLININSLGNIYKQDMEELSKYIKDIMLLNKDDFRIFSPDEAMSNRLYHIFDEEKRDWQEEIAPNDDYLSKEGRIIDSYLSENVCEGLLEGYTLTGRYGVFVSYEAFIRVVDSMVSQYIKWLKMSSEISWRKNLPPLTLILTSNVWQQDHNGFTHQDPGFISHLITKKHEYTNIYLPIDTNSLICTFNKCLKDNHCINTIISSKHPSKQWLNKDLAFALVSKGIIVLPFATTSNNPDIILTSCGDMPNNEALACVSMLKKYVPNIKLRFLNVLEPLKLLTLEDKEFNRLFTLDKPVIFNYHGYKSDIYSLVYKRSNKNFYVHGYSEEGSITTKIDLCMRNGIDRFTLFKEIINILDVSNKEELINLIDKEIKDNKEYIINKGIDKNNLTDWIF